MKNEIDDYQEFKKAFPDNGQHCDAVHVWFGLSYSHYLVLPRVLMEFMPAEWQKKMVALLDEAAEVWEHDDNYSVQLKGKDGKFKKDPLSVYRYPDYAALKEALKKK